MYVYSRIPPIRPPSESHWCGRIRGMVAREGGRSSGVLLYFILTNQCCIIQHWFVKVFDKQPAVAAAVASKVCHMIHGRESSSRVNPTPAKVNLTYLLVDTCGWLLELIPRWPWVAASGIRHLV